MTNENTSRSDVRNFQEGSLEKEGMSSFLPFLVFGRNLAEALAALLHNEVNLEMESLSAESKTAYWPWSNFLKFCKREINFCLI